MRLCLVEDGAVAGLEPLSLTRPAYELLLVRRRSETRSRGPSGSVRNRHGTVR